MSTLYLTHQYSLVKRDGDTLKVHIPENKETGELARKVRVPLMKIERVMVQGNITLTGEAIRLLLKQNIPVAFCSYYGRFEGMLSSADSKNGLLRQAQHEMNRNERKRTEIARAIVLGKLHNQRVFLQRSNRKHKSEDVTLLMTRIANAITSLKKAPLMDDFASVQSYLMGQEGVGARHYFQAYRHLLRDKMGFERRIRRPPTDPINAMLSYGYTILSSATISAVQLVGFDAYTGYLHSSHYGRPALALDLMEEFRAPIVDSVILRLVNMKIIKANDFREEGMSIRLTERGRGVFLKALEQRMNSDIKHPIFNYKASYRRCLELQARILARHIQGEINAYTPFKMR